MSDRSELSLSVLNKPLMFNKRILTYWVLSISLISLLSFGCSPKTETLTNRTSVHLTFGNPSHATTNVTNEKNFLIEKAQYVLSYNNANRTPNWVSWQLNRSWLGSIQRQNNFRPDDTLPSGWYRVTPTDYIGSGYDKGHMTPSADRTRSETDNSATFLMTNIIPQTPDDNRGPWEQLEVYCRDLVYQGRELYIISGGYGQQGWLKDRISIPAKTWKIIIVLDQLGQGISNVTSRTRAIAVDIPNVQGIKETNWRTYRTTIHKIETATGYNFLSNVPKSIQNVIENRVDSQ
jgi:endonuclease G